MDPPCFTKLCFLLLTIAAPCPNIAVPSDNRAEGTHGSSSSKTKVTVYHCKDCESNTCESSDYEGFEKIGETQDETYSNKIIQLMTREKRIIMCLQQANTFSEGIYAIVWEKATGVGDSCSILNSGASSENGTGNINIKETKTCCEAETEPSVPNRRLKCYTEKPDKKNGESAANIIDEGNQDNPQFSVSKNSIIGIITAVSILGACAVALATYCVRRHRNGQAVIQARWTPDTQKLSSV